MSAAPSPLPRRGPAAERSGRMEVPDVWKPFFPVPRAILDLNKRDCIRGSTQRACMDIIADTVIRKPEYSDDGFGPWARIPLRTFARETASSERECSESLRDAAEAGILERREEGRETLYRLRPDRWAMVRPYSERKAAAKKPEPEGPEEEAEAGGDDAAAAKKAERTIVVLPGKASRPVTLAEAVKRVRFDAPVETTFAWAIDRDVLSVSVKQLNSGATVPLTTALPKLQPSDAGSANCTKNTGATAPLTKKDLRRETLRRRLDETASQVWGAPIDDALFARIESALGRCSLDLFFERVSKRLKRGNAASPALLVAIAADARKQQHLPTDSQQSSSPGARAVGRASGAEGDWDPFEQAKQVLRRHNAEDWELYVCGVEALRSAGRELGLSPTHIAQLCERALDHARRLGDET